MNLLFEDKHKSVRIYDDIVHGQLGFLVEVETLGISNTKRIEAHEAVKLIAKLEARL